MLARPEWTAFPISLPVAARQREQGGLVGLVRLWKRRIVQRRELATLDARMLRDIGVTRTEAQHEAAKPFWRG
jgi:uncharacterized protein YjiS (DUF1127 family)